MLDERLVVKRKWTHILGRVAHLLHVQEGIGKLTRQVSTFRVWKKKADVSFTRESVGRAHERVGIKGAVGVMCAEYWVFEAH